MKEKQRIRVSGIIPMEDGIALMHRKDVIKRPEMPEYYTIPGGGLEDGETYEEGTKREIREEFGIEVEIVRKLYELKSEKFNQLEIFYLCKYVEGEFGTGTGPEFSGNPKYIDSGKYLPEIIDKKEVNNLLLLPSEIKEKLVEDIKSGKV